MDYEAIGKMYAEWYKLNTQREILRMERSRTIETEEVENQWGREYTSVWWDGAIDSEYQDAAIKCGTLRRKIHRLIVDGDAEACELNAKRSEMKATAADSSPEPDIPF